MNKQQLIDAIAKRSTQHRDAGLSKAQVEACLATLADVAHGELITEDGEIPLPGLGKLKATVKAERTGRNPQTGEALHIAQRNGVKFTA